MRKEKCICSHIETAKKDIVCSSNVRIIMHYKEERLPTNTGRLAKLLLPECEIWLRGQEGCQFDWDKHISEIENPLFLYPSEKAKVLSPETLQEYKKTRKKPDAPVTLFLPDGNWKQASKVGQRIAALKDMPHFILPQGEPTKYRLRHEPKEGGLATFEAIARALGILENPKLQAQLESIFDLMVERTLETRAGH